MGATTKSLVNLAIPTGGDRGERIIARLSQGKCAAAVACSVALRSLRALAGSKALDSQISRRHGAKRQSGWAARASGLRGRARKNASHLHRIGCCQLSVRPFKAERGGVAKPPPEIPNRHHQVPVRPARPEGVPMDDVGTSSRNVPQSRRSEFSPGKSPTELVILLQQREIITAERSSMQGARRTWPLRHRRRAPRSGWARRSWNDSRRRATLPVPLAQLGCQNGVFFVVDGSDLISLGFCPGESGRLRATEQQHAIPAARAAFP